MTKPPGKFRERFFAVAAFLLIVPFVFRVAREAWRGGLDLRQMALVIGLVAFVAFAAFAYLAEDRVARKALARGKAGDADGGMRMIRDAVRAKGPSLRRSDALGVLLLLKGEPGEALEAFRDAKARIKIPMFDRDRIDVHQADALERLGRPGDALGLVDQVLGRAPTHFAAKCVRVQCLFGLGRKEEASKQLEMLETSHAQMKSSVLGFGFADELARCEARSRQTAAVTPPERGAPADERS